MNTRLRLSLLLLGVVAGAFGGRLVGHGFGERFSLPFPPNPTQWQVISAGLQEGVGRAGAGRITHVAEGGLNIATHEFFRPDVVSPLFSGDAHRVVIELAEDSGVLWVQMGAPPGQFVTLRPGAMMAGRVGLQGADVGGARRFELREKDGNLLLTGGGKEISAGPFVPGRVELSAQQSPAKISRIQIANGRDEWVFDADFRGTRTPAHTLDHATQIGALIGLCLASVLIPFSWPAMGFGLIFLTPIIFALMQPRGVWLSGVERLYLSEIPPSQWARFILMVSILPLGLAAFGGHLKRLAQKQWRFGFWFWLAGAVMAVGIGVTAAEPAMISLVVLIFFGLSALFFGDRKALAGWWWADGLFWLTIPVIGLDYGAALSMAWRLISVATTAGMWAKLSARSAVTMMFISLFVLPVGLEAALLASPAGGAWVMSRLNGERPNEKGWESPVAGWSGSCGAGDQAVTVVVAGGSSVGGAYQFADEPEAFFSAVAHHDLCEQLPDGLALKTLNFGDGDRNTFTISRTIASHLNEADVLVLYVGVNDIFTTQNSKTRKQRETLQLERSETSKTILSWFSNARLAVGASLWFRGQATEMAVQVADVPINDARENHALIVNAARKAGVTVILMTEYVDRSQRERLSRYARMQKEFLAPDVQFVDVRGAFEGIEDAKSLIDRNHLSRSGNKRLGLVLAEALRPSVYGSSL